MSVQCGNGSPVAVSRLPPHIPGEWLRVAVRSQAEEPEATACSYELLLFSCDEGYLVCQGYAHWYRVTDDIQHWRCLLDVFAEFFQLLTRSIALDTVAQADVLVAGANLI